MYQDDSDQAQAALSALFGQGNGMQDQSQESAFTDDAQQDAAVSLAYDVGSTDGTARYDQEKEYETVEELESRVVSDGGRTSTRIAKRISPGALVVYLLKGHIDREDHPVVFDAIVSQSNAVSNLCQQLFLRLVVDESAGYAYVKSLSEEDIPTVQGVRPPQLLVRRKLSFFASFILILLRQRLLEFEVSGQFGRLVLERQHIIDHVKAYILNVNNDIKLTERIEKAIDDLCEMGVLKATSVEISKTVVERIEVRRIINAIVTPEVLNQADEILASYIQHLREGGRNKNI